MINLKLNEEFFEYMNVYINLEFYDGIKGVIKYLDKWVNTMIIKMALNEYIKKISGILSWGNKCK